MESQRADGDYQYRAASTVVVVLLVVNQRSKLHTYSDEVPVMHTPVEVRFSITCRFVDRQSRRGNVQLWRVFFFSLENQGKKGSLRSRSSLKWTICQVCDTKSTAWYSWSMSHDVICIQRTAMYVIRNQAETAEDAESTSEHIRIRQYAIFQFDFWRRNYMYTTNCKECDTI